MADSTSNTYNIPSLERALRIMEFLAKQPKGCGASEIADQLGYPRNSVFRILRTLNMHGYVWRNEMEKTYQLSTKLLALGYATLGENNLVEKSLDIMRELRDETKETVLIGTIAGNEGIVLEQVPSLYQVKFLVDPGHRFPLHTAAPGKAMLAFLPDEEQDKLLDQLEYTRFTGRTITRKEALRAELADVREKGYARDLAEEIEGLHCVAVPVFNHCGYPIASIWVTGPSYRLPPKEFGRFGKSLAEKGTRISQRFGYKRP